jgi:WhiB family redox-sensing transcriptional regulator
VSVDVDALFFPEGRQGSAQVERQVRAAKAVCAGCPVLSACRAWALANPSLTGFGVWGGVSEQERALVGKLLAARAVARARRAGTAAVGVAG